MRKIHPPPHTHTPRLERLPEKTLLEKDLEGCLDSLMGVGGEEM